MTTATKPRRTHTRKAAPTPEQRAELLVDALGALVGILDAVLDATKRGGVFPVGGRQLAEAERRRIVARIAKALGVAVVRLAKE